MSKEKIDLVDRQLFLSRFEESDLNFENDLMNLILNS